MKTHVTTTPLEGVLVINIDYFKDDRGFFIEAWHRRDFAEAGITDDFVQDSHSQSTYRVIRGLHYQDMRAPMAKLVRCTVGKVLDVAVDLRVRSATFGKYYAIELSAENQTQIYIPIGFAHGFATLSDVCEIQYKQTAYYRPETEGGIAWNDPDLAFPWPFKDPLLSNRDRNQRTIKQYLQQPAFT